MIRKVAVTVVGIALVVAAVEAVVEVLEVGANPLVIVVIQVKDQNQ